MKKIKFIFLNIFIIVFVSAISVFAADVKKPLTAQTPPQGTSTAPAQNQTQPVPAAATVPVQDQDKTQSPTASSLTQTSIDAYNYSPLGKPDPFRPFIVVETVEKKKVEKKAPPSMFPLQRAETGMYRVVGIAGDEYNRVAIAEDSAKKFYPLLKGTRIGLRNGKVVEIMADRVIVEEYEGKKTKRVILKLRKN